MTTSIFICHCEADTQWVDLLVEYLEACSEAPASIRCSYLPGYALSNDESDSEDLKEALMRADVVVAITTHEALASAQYMVELGASWAFDTWIIPVMRSRFESRYLPKPIRDLTPITLNGPDDAIILAQQMNVGHVDSQQSQTALHRLFENPDQLKMRTDVGAGSVPTQQTTETDVSPTSEQDISQTETKSEAEASREAALHQHSENDNQLEMRTDVGTASIPTQQTTETDVTSTSEQDIPQAEMKSEADASRETASSPIDSAPSSAEEKVDYPSPIASLNAGIAFTDCVFNRNDTSSFAKELDNPLGTFVKALGGNWDALRKLDDVDIYNSATENLMTSLPPTRSEISCWYDIGSRISTMLNIAGRGLPQDAQERELTEQKWQSCFSSFRYLAMQVNISDQDVADIQEMLKNLIGPPSDKDYTNMARCLDKVRQCAMVSNRGITLQSGSVLE
jgi:hypothetical protein